MGGAKIGGCSAKSQNSSGSLTDKYLFIDRNSAKMEIIQTAFNLIQKNPILRKLGWVRTARGTGKQGLLRRQTYKTSKSPGGQFKESRN